MATPTPTPTATPTPTPEPCPPSDVSAYFDRVREADAALAEVMGTLGELAYRLSIDPTLVDNPEWNTQTTEVSSVLRSVAQQIREIQPVPSSVLDIHADLEELAVLLDGGFEAFGQSLGSGDPQLVVIGDQRFAFSIEARSRVAQALSGFCG